MNNTNKIQEEKYLKSLIKKMSEHGHYYFGFKHGGGEYEICRQENCVNIASLCSDGSLFYYGSPNEENKKFVFNSLNELTDAFNLYLKK